LFGAVAVIYKGSGFYTTDYKRKDLNPGKNGSQAEGEKAHSHEE